jgi:3-polyprenyl-4-hydroxybenzoate decarboxylase
MFHAKDAVFPATVVGKPRQEDYYIGEYLQRLLRPLFPLAMPGVVDLWSYGETGFHALAAATVRERYGREAMVSAFRILGEGQLALTKFLLVTDQHVELKNFKKTLETVLERADFSRDLYIFDHLSMDTLDYCGPEVNKGSKGILLGLGEPRRSLPGGFQGELPKHFGAAKAFCRGCLVVSGEPFAKARDLGERAAKESSFRDWSLVILVDDVKKTLSSDTAFLWTVFTRFEPAADLHAASELQNRHHIGYQPPIVIDARMKPNYPKELFCDPDIAAQVTRRWNEYFPKGMEQGSSDSANL